MSSIDLRLTRAKELLETALRMVTEGIEAREKGEPMKAGRSAAMAERIARRAADVICSTFKKPH